MITSNPTPTDIHQAIDKPIGHIKRALFGAALILAIALALRLATPSYLSTELSKRLLGVLLGAVVIANANAVPKMLPRRLPVRRDPAEEQSERRFVGWSLAVGGLGYSGAWILAPIGTANTIAGLLLGCSLLLAMGRVVIGRNRPAR
jgi:hypothetical protein